jgi:hypothetical protein
MRCAHKVYNDAQASTLTGHDPDLASFDHDDAQASTLTGHPDPNVFLFDDDVRVFFNDDTIDNNFDTTGYKIFSIEVNDELVTIMYKENHRDVDDDTYPSDSEDDYELSIKVNNNSIHDESE